MSMVKPIPDGVPVVMPMLPVKNQFWGDRTGRIVDPSGHVWIISTRVEATSSSIVNG
jgi:uncharacterized glyoxalase superfamily protein PhnB